MNDEECVQWIMRRKEKGEEGIRIRSMRGKKTMRHHRTYLSLSPAPLFAAYSQQLPDFRFYAAFYQVIFSSPDHTEEYVSSTIKLQGEEVHVKTKSICSKWKRDIEFSWSSMNGTKFSPEDRRILRTISTIMRHFIEEEGYNRMDHVYHTYTYSYPDYLRI